MGISPCSGLDGLSTNDRLRSSNRDEGLSDKN